ncbi:preprotein translocase subunit SecA [Crateriforma conspicua]|uniref:Protein translocase subunit SecA n=1 Tax=Crateriforma conspicua TaxID=2527996 RepID=A0A5C5XY34_9PLAN|nr:preprotein translocase subunit SecA [Crateriforma conspicua]TWT67794.1 preprotein translocase subunit SecA [Crateriforma conspicua]
MSSSPTSRDATDETVPDPTADNASASTPGDAKPPADAAGDGNQPAETDPFGNEGSASDPVADALALPDEDATEPSADLPAELPAELPAVATDESADNQANKRRGAAKQTNRLTAKGARLKMSRWRAQLARINEFESVLQPEDDASLRKRSLALRYRAMAGEKLGMLLPEAYALAREAGRRALSMRHYDVQMIGGISLFEGHIAEMQTGEGKTLTATLPLYLHSLVGKGAHLATVNDYLAKRDAEWMQPLYAMLGVSVGIIQTPDDQGSRRKSYAAAVTYGTAKEFGFDFLRDRLLLRAQNRMQTESLGDGAGGFSGSGDQPVMRGMHFCLVDEADSILIDEARTPLIIGSIEDNVRDQIVETYRWAAQHAEEYEEDEHYDIDNETKQYELTARGRQKVRSLPKPDLVRTMGLVDLYEYTERAIKVAQEFLLNRQYVVRPGDQGTDEIVIVDEFTGRLAEGRKWRDGIHQAIEAKENIEISVPTGQAARITVQDLFLRYPHLAGMTGTAATSAAEMKKIYRTPVIRVPTNRPPQRKQLPDQVFGDMLAKFEAIVDEVKRIHETGRPVLIGTRSIDKSEIVSRLLNEINIPHEVLNANNVEREAEIVSAAGARGKVTVATNMAGRGTDIKLSDEIEALGGMHVICTELHDAARIDRQLIGRCGRQGDQGSYRQYLSLDDDILKVGLGVEKAKRMKTKGENLRGAANQYAKMFRKAQRKVERKHFRDRMVLMHHEKERKKMQREIGQDPYLDTPD